jgi:hypothetical protein
MQDSHESARFCITGADLLAKRPPGLLIAGTRLGSRGRKLSPHLLAKLHNLRLESGHSIGQLFENLDSAFQHFYRPPQTDDMYYLRQPALRLARSTSTPLR